MHLRLTTVGRMLYYYYTKFFADLQPLYGIFAKKTALPKQCGFHFRDYSSFFLKPSATAAAIAEARIASGNAGEATPV